jgi:hypothetical protein
MEIMLLKSIYDAMESASQQGKRVKDVSSFIANIDKKQRNARKGVVPVDRNQIGNIELNWIQDDTNNLYRCVWKSRLNNSTTTLSRLGVGKYLVSRTAPKMEPIGFMFSDKEPAIRAFFYNTDLFRIKDDIAKEARKWCADHIKRAEGLKNLYFNPKRNGNAQRNFNRIIKVGKNKQHTARLLGVDYTGTKVRVRIEDPETNTLGKEVVVNADAAWYD